jgi:hypothetical protein
LDRDALRALITWHEQYRPEWDRSPDEYVAHGVVPWARSRRIGMLRLGAVKAYIGIQHVDPSAPGWGIVEEPTTRVFLSLFVLGQCVTLRTFPDVQAALEALAGFLADRQNHI